MNKVANYSKLKIGMKFKSYKYVCEFLDEPYKTGSPRDSQWREWKQYFNWTQNKWQWTITEVYDEPRLIPKIMISPVRGEIDMTCEIWKDIKGYEGFYQVSSYGRVKSLSRTIWNNANGGFWQTLNEKILSLFEQGSVPRKYVAVRLIKDGTNKRVMVHRIVAEHFIGEIPDGMVVNHIDNDPKNNRVDNLEIITPSENIQKARDAKRIKKHVRTKIKLEDIETGEVMIFSDAAQTGEFLGMWGTSVIKHADGLWSDIIRDKYKISRVS